MPSVIFTGGGTGGHLVPGLAVAERLVEQSPGLRVVFVGAGKPVERQLTQEAGFELVAVPCRPAPHRLSDLPGFLWHNLRGYLAAGGLIERVRPSVVVGLGGYASVAAALAAARRGVPLVLLEQNAVPGRANLWLAQRAAVACTAFLETADHLPTGLKVRLTGNPVRRGPDAATHRTDPAHGHGRLVVLGGSGGAHSLNAQVPHALRLLGPRLEGWRVVHQSGTQEAQATTVLYQSLGVPAEVTPFVADVPELLSTADVVVCRAGGTTLAELAAAGVPAVVVPYPDAAGDHQRRNAEAVAAAGACVLVDERAPGPPLSERLEAVLGRLLAEPAARRQMAAAMRRTARPDAAQRVAEIVLEAGGL